MKKLSFVVFLFLAMLLVGCKGSFLKSGVEKLTGNKPPTVIVEIDGENYQTILGTYCWQGDTQGVTKCVDTAGSVDLLEGKEPIKVKAGEQIVIDIEYTPKPDEIHLTQTKNGIQTEIKLTDSRFIAPVEKGTYFYDYGVWWMDEKVENTSRGDASYAFAIDVE